MKDALVFFRLLFDYQLSGNERWQSNGVQANIDKTGIAVGPGWKSTSL
nr:hypothetical protein [uncultured Oscillibacter sp.]